MSHFYASIPESARKTVATARGHKTTGITVKAASWAGAVEVRMYHNDETGKDEFSVHQVPHHGEGVSRMLFEGVVGKSRPRYFTQA
jgi:hypothetical protein|tara:strand:+ start:516 stop:773 length:258 start_codon:yes stop_codon:yes gene_type:complete